MAKTKDSVKDPLSGSASTLQKDEVEITHPDQLVEIQDKNKLAGFSGWFFLKTVPNVEGEGTHEIRVPSINDKGEYVFVKGAKAVCKVIPAIILAIGLFCGQAFATVAVTDEAVLGNDRWSVQTDGDFVPGSDSDLDIGASGAEVDNIYADSLWLNGVEITSFSSGTDGHFTLSAGVLTADSAPTKWIFTASTGVLETTGFTVGTADITFANGAKLDGDTANEIRLIENSDTLKIGFSGDDITLDSTDGGVIFALTDATDGQVSFKTNNDTDDFVEILTSSNQPQINFDGASGKITASGGAIDFDDENLTTTGTLSAGAVTGTSFQVGDDIWDVVVDDILRFASNDEKSTIEAYGFEAKAGALRLTTDEGDDAGDTWEAIVEVSTDSLLFTSDAAVDNTQATILTLSGVGLLTTTGDVKVEGTTPLVTIGDGGDEDIGIQLNSDTNDFYISSENTLDDFMIGLGSVIGTTPVVTITDTGIATLTGSTDGNLLIWGAGTTASDAKLQLVGDAQADASDGWQFHNDSSAAALLIGVDSTTPGTYVTVTQINSTGDWTFSGTTPFLTIGDAGEEDAGVVFDGNAQDFVIGLDDSVDDLVFSLGSALGTTNVLEFTDTGVAKNTGSTDGDFTIHAAGTTASDAYLRLVGDAGADAADRWQFFNDSSGGDLFIQNDSGVAGTYVTKMHLDTTGATVIHGTTDGSLDIYADGTTASDAYLRLIGDAQTDASDSAELFMDSSAGTLYFGIDSTAAATYITKASLDSTGAFTVQGSEATAGSISIWADNGDDAADKFGISVADGGATTISLGVENPITIGATGAVGIAKMFGLPTYAAAKAPASGAASATSGAVIAIHDARSAVDCGNIGGGTFMNVCLSDGTNWIDL